MRGTDEVETILDLVLQDRSRIGAVFFSISEDNVRKVLRLPWVSFGSDGASMAPEGVFLAASTHPRAYGNVARLLGKYVRDEKIVALTEAVRRLTSLPAANLGLEGRGLLKAGMFADVVVFDPATIADRATFDRPAPVCRRYEARPGQWCPGPSGRRAHRRHTRSRPMGSRQDPLGARSACDVLSRRVSSINPACGTPYPRPAPQEEHAEEHAESSPRGCIHLEGVVAAVTPSTPHVRAVVDCGFPLVAALTPRSVRELALVPGVNVAAVFEASAAHLIPYRGYSMISSICASNAGEIVNPSARAVFRFITAWSLVGCSTGRSAGLAPLMILST